MSIAPRSPVAEDTRIDVVDWVLRTCVAVLFGSVGYEKLSPAPGSYWVTLFAQIGFGEWFMYLTGGMQVLGAILVLVPRTSLIGAALVGSTMVGAIVCHLALLDTGVGGAVFPAAFLVLVIAAARRRLKGPPADPGPVELRLRKREWARQSGGTSRGSGLAAAHDGASTTQIFLDGHRVLISNGIAVADRQNARVVYSTATGRICPDCGGPLDRCQGRHASADEPIPSRIVAKMRMERAGRGGKTVTVIDGLPRNAAFLKELCQELKRAAGCGGAVQEGAIELQGDLRDRVREFLARRGLTVKG